MTTTITNGEITQVYTNARAANDEGMILVALKARGDFANVEEIAQVTSEIIEKAFASGGKTSVGNDARVIMGLIDRGAEMEETDEWTIMARGDGYEVEIDTFRGTLERCRRVVAMSQDEARAECARHLAQEGR